MKASARTAELCCFLAVLTLDTLRCFVLAIRRSIRSRCARSVNWRRGFFFLRPTIAVGQTVSPVFRKQFPSRRKGLILVSAESAVQRHTV
jgi:hypothetical protein